MHETELANLRRDNLKRSADYMARKFSRTRTAAVLRFLILGIAYWGLFVRLVIAAPLIGLAMLRKSKAISILASTALPVLTAAAYV